MMSLTSLGLSKMSCQVSALMAVKLMLNVNPYSTEVSYWNTHADLSRFRKIGSRTVFFMGNASTSDMAMTSVGDTCKENKKVEFHFKKDGSVTIKILGNQNAAYLPWYHHFGTSI